MTNTAETGECLHCGKEFVKAHSRHVYCQPACRHQGPPEWGNPAEQRAEEAAAVARLFAEDRDPSSPVLDTDWHPCYGEPNGAEWAALDMGDTVGTRRGWYLRSRRSRVP